MKNTILLVEDEKGLADSLATELGFEDYNVISASDGLAAVEEFQKNKETIDLILLDWMLPKLDGLGVLRRIRKESQVPVIMLTARNYIGDKVAGLDGGADDYITKPFEIEELLARIRVAIRRVEKQENHQAELYQLDDLTLNIKTHQVFRDDEKIQLTQREFDLLKTLFEHENEVLTRDDILDLVWGKDFLGQTNIVDVYIRLLRNKINDNHKDEQLIKTIRGVGYSLSKEK
ncbi:MAG TPA: response regulator transcription factor [Candidatus Ligilactobacillus excrementigallinarum]|uniref:Response regulator transcription factor n=1 Tax=Candidatus Ligilactobacillus excrementigallinarum TaxID=2838641 RepID=A0A9D2A9S1_9LACO|nr:response regulator transcription factor [Candidatus Ligilactobacillus excrementigallinarum]